MTSKQGEIIVLMYSYALVVAQIPVLTNNTLFLHTGEHIYTVTVKKIVLLTTCDSQYHFTFPRCDSHFFSVWHEYEVV